MSIVLVYLKMGSSCKQREYCVCEDAALVGDLSAGRAHGLWRPRQSWLVLASPGYLLLYFVLLLAVGRT